MIEVKGITKRFGPTLAVDDLSFSIAKGEVVGFLGPNGAGKTTTMRILTCFMPATSGKATVDGFDVFTQSLEVRQRIGYMPENTPLYPEMRVSEYLNFRARLKGVPYTERRKKIGYRLDQCGIADVQHRIIGQLSKGYRQRVGLAEALLHDPKVLILDEPTIGLDPNQIRQTRQLIRDLGKNHTVILSTHILPEVSMVCDSIIIINRGRVVAKGTQAELVEQVFPAARVEVEVAGPAEAIASSLKTLPGVTSVEAIGVEAIGVKAAGAGDGASRFVVESPRGRDVRGELVRLVAGRGWELLELHQVGLSLEEVFIRVVAGEEHAPQVLESVVDTAQ